LLSSHNISAHYSKTEAVFQEHMQRARQNIRSTKIQIPVECEFEEEEFEIKQESKTNTTSVPQNKTVVTYRRCSTIKTAKQY